MEDVTPMPGTRSYGDGGKGANATIPEALALLRHAGAFIVNPNGARAGPLPSPPRPPRRGVCPQRARLRCLLAR